jgi:hypothetical protein
MSNRDDFTKQTTDILAKRVGYLCSNPSCRNPTVGPNDNPEKATIIGIAAHITAASPQGPRYDETLDESERKHINNGIWLCSNCATLIDKDKAAFPVEILLEWKNEAETELREKLKGTSNTIIKKDVPFLEADLIWNHGGRRNRGYSDKNPTELDDNGQLVYTISFLDAIVYWALDWNFSFTIHNNSRVPAYNISIETIGDIRFSKITNLPKTNNLPPFQSIDLDAEYKDFLEGNHKEADELLKYRIPQKLEGLTMKINYQDDERKNHTTVVRIDKGQIINIKE